MKLTIGTAQFGLNYGINNQSGKVDRNNIDKIKALAKEYNINSLDTAQAYGESENIIGEVFERDFKVISKLMPGISSCEVGHSVELSLKKLRRDKVYAVLFHDYNDYCTDKKSYDVLIDYKQNRRIEKIGFSLYYPHELDELLISGVKFDIIQVPFSIFDQRFRPYFRELKYLNVEIYVRSIFLQGLVFIEPNSFSYHFHEYVSLFEEFHEKVLKSGKSINEVCINFVHNFSDIDNIIVGVCSARELKNNIDSVKSMQNDDLSFYQSLNHYAIENEDIILPFNWR